MPDFFLLKSFQCQLHLGFYRVCLDLNLKPKILASEIQNYLFVIVKRFEMLLRMES